MLYNIVLPINNQEWSIEIEALYNNPGEFAAQNTQHIISITNKKGQQYCNNKMFYVQIDDQQH